MLDTIFTIGHSTRTIEEFISLLNTYDISLVVDVRTIPKSRHNPQFGEDEISKSLKAAKIKYKQLPLLGGLRPTTKDFRTLFGEEANRNKLIAQEKFYINLMSNLNT